MTTPSERAALYWTEEALDLDFMEELGPAAEDLVRCADCGSCTASCPTANRMAVVPHRLGRLIRLGLKGEALESLSFWQCTSCAACSLHCPRGIDILRVIVALKRYARREGLEPPPEVAALCRAVMESHNISGEPNRERLRWSANLPQRLTGLDRDPSADMFYFVGCIASFYPRAYGIAQDFSRLLALAGLRVTTLGGEEWCCGYPLLNAGMEEEARALVEHNLERIQRMGARTVVMTCPTCFYTWHTLYPRLTRLPRGLRLIHATQLLAELVESGRLRPAPVRRVVTYHDPCDLGRKSGEFDAPRAVLEAIPGLRLVEMANSGKEALCCGGGGDVKLLDLETTLDVARRRIQQAIDVDSEVVATACQQCKRALTSAVQAMRKPIKVRDVVEVLWDSVADQAEW